MQFYFKKTLVNKPLRWYWLCLTVLEWIPLFSEPSLMDEQHKQTQSQWRNQGNCRQIMKCFFGGCSQGNCVDKVECISFTFIVFKCCNSHGVKEPMHCFVLCSCLQGLLKKHDVAMLPFHLPSTLHEMEGLYTSQDSNMLAIYSQNAAFSIKCIRHVNELRCDVFKQNPQ